MGEAVALARKAGIDTHRFVEILTDTLFSAPVYNTYGAIIADENYEPAGFKMTLGLKDIKLALAAAESLNVPLPIASLVRDHFLSGIAQGQGDSDLGRARTYQREKFRALKHLSFYGKRLKCWPGVGGTIEMTRRAFSYSWAEQERAISQNT